MKKVIKIDVEAEVEFADGFVPPRRYDAPSPKNNWRSKCDLCPFFKWYDERGYGVCLLLGENRITNRCPIKKNFK